MPVIPAGAGAGKLSSLPQISRTAPLAPATPEPFAARALRPPPPYNPPVEVPTAPPEPPPPDCTAPPIRVYGIKIVSLTPNAVPPVVTDVVYTAPERVTVIDHVPDGAVPPEPLVTTTPALALVIVNGPPVPLVATPLVDVCCHSVSS